MNEEEYLRKKDMLEREIARLCNIFSEDTTMHIDRINVYNVDHAPGMKGWFSDDIVHVEIAAHKNIILPVEEIKRREAEAEFKREKNV